MISNHDDVTKNISKIQFEAYMDATKGAKSYLIADKKKSGLPAEIFISIADNLQLLKEKYPDTYQKYLQGNN